MASVRSNSRTRNSFSGRIVYAGMAALQAQGVIHFNKIVYGRIAAWCARELEAATIKNTEEAIAAGKASAARAAERAAQRRAERRAERDLVRKGCAA